MAEETAETAEIEPRAPDIPTDPDVFAFSISADGKNVTLTLPVGEALDALRNSGKTWLARSGAMLIPSEFNPRTPEQSQQYAEAYAEWGGGILELADQIECDQLRIQMGIKVE